MINICPAGNIFETADDVVNASVTLSDVDSAAVWFQLLVGCRRRHQEETL